MTDTILPGAVTGAPSALLRSEGLAVLAGATTLYAHQGAGWWLFAGLFLLPDMSMLGYLAGRRVGAAAYNAAHTYVAPALLLAIGWLISVGWAMPVALIWIAHIGFDRAAGYGLKYASAFGDTHLGRKGRAA